MSFNQQTIVGRLGRKPELKQTNRGGAVVELSVATKYKYKDEEETEWHSVVLFDKAAENACQYLDKGREVFIVGRTKTQAWKTQSGEERSRKIVLCEKIVYLGSGSGQSQKQESQNQQAPAAQSKASDSKFGGW